MGVLGSALQREGHEVVVAAPPDARSLIAEYGLAFAPLGFSFEPALRNVWVKRAVSIGEAHRAGGRLLLASLDSQMRVLPDLAADAEFIIAGGIHPGVPSIAERYRIPWRWVVYSVTMLPSTHHPPMTVPFGRAPRVVNWLAWNATHWLMQRGLRPALNAHRERLGLPAIDSVADHLMPSRPILAADPELAPLAADMPECDLIGHLDPGQGCPLPAELERFLERGPPPLYVGFGSMPALDARAATDAIVQACERVGCRLVLSRGWAGLGEQELPPHCIAIGPVSHARLFARVAGIVHHGGAGTTSAALRSGAPQLIVPHVADQHHFAVLVEKLGIGVASLRRERLSTNELAARIERMLNDKKVIERARDLGDAVRARPALANVSRLLVTKRPRSNHASVPAIARISIQPGA